MSSNSSPRADKNIVDRTKAHRNTDVAKAVRRMRDRLSQKAGNPVFDREMVKLHARAMINSAMAIPLLVILIAAAGLPSASRSRPPVIVCHPARRCR